MKSKKRIVSLEGRQLLAMTDTFVGANEKPTPKIPRVESLDNLDMDCVWCHQHITAGSYGININAWCPHCGMPFAALKN